MSDLQERRLGGAPIGETVAIVRATIVAGAIATVVVAADQVSKSWALDRLQDGPIALVGSAQFALVFNRGVAFGLGDGVAPFLVGIAVLGVLGFAYSRRDALSPAMIAAVGLVVGGAAGNISDRLFRSTGGAVVDFVDLGWWPVFNVADAAIVIGAILLAIASFKRREVDG